MCTQEEPSRMGMPHPDLLAATKEVPFPDLTRGKADATTIDVRRNRAAHLATVRHLYPIPGPIPDTVKETEHHVEARDGYIIRIKIYVPTTKPANGSPLIVMMHEGGWSMGDLTDEDLNCRMFARDIGAVCVNVDYRLAPEYAFPTGVYDCQDVVRWCAKTASPSSSVIPADPSRGFIVGGASAGGNLAAVMCQLSRDEGLAPPLTGQYLCVPALLWTGDVPDKWKTEYRSRYDSASDPVLRLRSDGASQLMQDLKPETSSPLFSPLLHPDLKSLPPAYFQLAGLDPLRDEGLLYERVLREENNVPTKLDVYDGFGHMFWTNWPKMQRSIDFVNDTLEGFRWLLHAGAAPVGT
ncbi:hypothetical protein BAUCODRAFT_459685 [Baudoinia panamericana UAMH 10762]|uniref:Alpha/beta hydrolase fold-3 domain-containing protein n=1 Tax=Baudoinia panamericana (strain UAMH 10762) TaxID=717646 RepID=M2NF61_BAUPA|nr:uncharacterized protein BAUCODRAFT_459685 [Baudoinia panamericana UAMH 10762]EMC97610.1 hypothetical protein BAUCODRAFT_459685 [Baudoinia panamericana UAMH 10762]